MKKVKEMNSEGFYLIRGCSSANSSLFENENECLYFLELANRRFEGYLKIKCHSLMQDSWNLLCELGTKSSIMKKYEESRKKSQKVKEECKLKDVWRVISEQFRHFLSQYVKRINKDRGRKGSLRMASYSRFLIEDEKEGMSLLRNMRGREIEKSQERRRYWSLAAHWEGRKKKGMDRVKVEGVMSGKGEMLRGFLVEGAFDFIILTVDVLRTLITRTLNLHNYNAIRKGPKNPNKSILKS